MKTKRLVTVLTGGLIIALVILWIWSIPVVKFLVRASFLVFLLAVLALMAYVIHRMKAQ